MNYQPEIKYSNGCTVVIQSSTGVVRALDPEGQLICCYDLSSRNNIIEAETAARQWCPEPTSFTGDYTKWPKGTYKMRDYRDDDRIHVSAVTGAVRLGECGTVDPPSIFVPPGQTGDRWIKENE